MQTGETYEAALKRETFEEIMLDVDTVSYRFLGYISPFEHAVNGYFAAYEIVVPSSEISYNKNDFSEMICMTPDQLKKCIASGESATINLRKIIELFY